MIKKLHLWSFIILRDIFLLSMALVFFIVSIPFLIYVFIFHRKEYMKQWKKFRKEYEVTNKQKFKARMKYRQQPPKHNWRKHAVKYKVEKVYK